MANEPGDKRDPAERELAPGPLLPLRQEGLEVDVAVAAGGRLAQIRHAGRTWLRGPQPGLGAIAWGCYPMLPWAGRIRHGRFDFAGRRYQLPASLGGHAIHGVGFMRPWQLERHDRHACELALALPRDADWPFGGQARQRIELLDGQHLRLQLSLTADDRPMPRPVLGWHPWLRKPRRLRFQPEAMYPRDADGIARLPPGPARAGPWDDCFLQHGPIHAEHDGIVLELSSDCAHWVIYDQPVDATCVEPQTGPPDAFNLHPDAILEAGASVHARFDWRWHVAATEPR